jgi:ribosomal protein S18 acetylase RimI-like enzyme
MQFNAVVATNTIAVKLWQQLGFSIVGTIPDAYQHRREGLVDCHVMYKSMDVNEAKKSESQVR